MKTKQILARIILKKKNLMVSKTLIWWILER